MYVDKQFIFRNKWDVQIRFEFISHSLLPWQGMATNINETLECRMVSCRPSISAHWRLHRKLTKSSKQARPDLPQSWHRRLAPLRRHYRKTKKLDSCRERRWLSSLFSVRSDPQSHPSRTTERNVAGVALTRRHMENGLQRNRQAQTWHRDWHVTDNL